MSESLPRQGCACSMGIEEQKEEREVLDSIFPDEITGRIKQGWQDVHSWNS